MCVSGINQALPGALAFLGFFMTTFWLPAWSDIYGRKKFFAFAVVADMILLVCIMFTKSWAVVYVVGFLIGAVTSLRI